MKNNNSKLAPFGTKKVGVHKKKRNKHESIKKKDR
jgi:hypothetical protein